MNVFDLLTMFGGLAMFLYGMRLMGDGLKESSSGTLKVAMEAVTNSSIKAFLLGLLVTAFIQSSTATIVITSGLVAAGIITLKQSLGIIVGANVGTTVTGQIIRLLDLDSSSTGWLQIFKPSTLAPVALIIGIVIIMGFSSGRNSKSVGNIAIGFGILFSGLLNMTGAVSTLADGGAFDKLFTQLSDNPIIGYLTGAGVAFVLQSSSATIGILQAFSASGHLTFSAVYAVIVGVYLGDCVTTLIVCAIGAKPDAKRVGVINVLFNLGKTVLVLAAVAILKQAGLLDGIWDSIVNPGKIANANSIFNLACAVVLLPVIPVCEKMSYKIVKDEKVPANKYQDKLDALSPSFYSTPAMALRSCYDVLMTMFLAGRANTDKAISLVEHYDQKVFDEIQEEETNIDIMHDKLSAYLASLSAVLKQEYHILILNEYYKLVVEFERLGDYAVNIAEVGQELHEKRAEFSQVAKKEIKILMDLINSILDCAEKAFKVRDVEAAQSIEPLEEVVDDVVNVLKENHLSRLAKGECTVVAGTGFMDLLSDIERVSDICSNIGLATVARVTPELATEPHEYVYYLHSGRDEKFNAEYKEAHKKYFRRLKKYIPEIDEYDQPPRPEELSTASEEAKAAAEDETD